MNITKFTSVVQPFSNNGYYFFLHSISWAERLIYFFGFFLLKMSENDKDNYVSINLFRILKLEIKGVKDVVILLIIFAILFYAYFSKL